MTDHRKQVRVLLVEDDKFMVRLYQVRLAADGFQVETAMNGDECLEKVKASSPDIVLLDLMLPLMDGFTVLQKLKSNPDTSSVPVIVFSNRSSPQDVKRAMDLGATDFLVKVSTPPEDVIRKILSAIEMPSNIKQSQPDRYHLKIDWNTKDAKKMAADLGIPIEYKDGRCITDADFEAMVEFSHNEPWIMGRFIIKKKL
jgi:CheY-like chemotaxis protein